MVLARAVDLFFELLFLLILARVLLSWIRPDPYNPIIRTIYALTDPILEPFRQMLYRLIPQYGGMRIDFSPIIAIFVLDIIRKVLVRLVWSLGL